MDYYSILGVNRNASQEEIKKAYKKQSMQHHPDRGGDEAEFKKVNEAYQILGDAQKRAAYDNPQPRFDSNSFRGGNPFEDIFAQAFGGGFRQQPRARNSDVRIKVKITLEEVISGKKVIAAYRLRNGQEESVNLDIPPGARDGDTIRFTNLGDSSVPNIPRGDLYVTIGVIPKPNWGRNNNDLTTKIKINCLEMITGTKTLVNTLDGRNLELTVPAGTRNGTTFSVNGYGIPDLNTGTRGKLLITVDAEIPKNLSVNSINKIREVLHEISNGS